MNDSSRDVLSVMSFIIGVANYGENLTQNDKQDLMSVVDSQTAVLLAELSSRLDAQDEKLNRILTILEKEG